MDFTTSRDINYLIARDKSEKSVQLLRADKRFRGIVKVNHRFV